MPVKPLSPLAASPSLPLALQRITHTPAARLATTYLLQNRLFNDQFGQSLAVSQCRRPNSSASYCPPYGVGQPFERPLGVSLYLDRLVTGGIIGTRLAILDRMDHQELLATERREQWDAPTVGKNVDLHV